MSEETKNSGAGNAPSTWTRSDLLKRAGIVGIGAGVGGVVLAACGGSDGTTSAVATDTTESTGSNRPIASSLKGKKIGVVLFSSADENEGVLMSGLKQAVKEAGLEWDIQETDCQASQAKCEQATAAFVNQGVDAIILMVVASRLVEPQLAQAKQKNIPVFGLWTFSELSPQIVVDNTPPPASDSAAIAQFMCGDLYLRKPEGQIKLALLDTDLDILQARSSTILAITGLYPRIEIVDTADVNLEDPTGSTTTITQGFLSKSGDLDAIWTNYPPSAAGAATAVEQRGLSDQVGVYGHVAGKAGIQMLENSASALRGSSWVDLDWQAFAMCELMLQHFNGEEVSKLAGEENIAPPKVFSSLNIGEANGEGTASGFGWTSLKGTWKPQVVSEWSDKFS